MSLPLVSQSTTTMLVKLPKHAASRALEVQTTVTRSHARVLQPARSDPAARMAVPKIQCARPGGLLRTAKGTPYREQNNAQDPMAHVLPATCAANTKMVPQRGRLHVLRRTLRGATSTAIALCNEGNRCNIKKKANQEQCWIRCHFEAIYVSCWRVGIGHCC